MSQQQENKGVPILTIDGLSGTGKTSITSQIASDLGWRALYSGLFYRYLAHCQLKQRYSVHNGVEISHVIQLELTNLTCRVNPAGEVTVLAGNQNLSHILSSETVGRAASILAGNQAIREQLLNVQRGALISPGLVAEGRDMGRVVFPDATLKIFLSADEEVRVQRRYNQLNRCGNDVKIADVAMMQASRDERDLQQAYQTLDEDGVLTIDTSRMSIASVKQTIYQALHQLKVIDNLLTTDAHA
ncbi:MAG: cytidylate kinase [Legionellales bacterium]|nr:cytidylate kinase [Legionellales bacterium]HAV93392.1 (d)CMP kinase [Pseudomonadota bacterium]